MGILDGLFGNYSKRELKKIDPIKQKVLDLDEEYGKLTEAELKAKTPEFKKRLEDGETLDDILPEALATVREGAWSSGQKALPRADNRCHRSSSGQNRRDENR